MKAAEEGHTLANLIQREDAGVQSVVQVGGRIGDLVGQIDQLGLQRRPLVQKVPGQLRVFGRGVIAGVLHDAFAHAQGQIQAAKGRVPLLEPGDDAQGMKVVVKAEREAAQAAVESLFAGVAKGRMADVVHQREGLGQFRIQPQSRGQRARYLGHLQRVRQAAAKVVGRRSSRQPREDLGLARQPAKGARVQNPGGVPGESRAIGMRRFGMDAAGQFGVFIPADCDLWRQFGWQAGLLVGHGCASSASHPVIPQYATPALGVRLLRALNHYRFQRRTL